MWRKLHRRVPATTGPSRCLTVGIGMFIIIRSRRDIEAYFSRGKRKFLRVVLTLLSEYVGIVVCVFGIGWVLRCIGA